MRPLRGFGISRGFLSPRLYKEDSETVRVRMGKQIRQIPKPRNSGAESHGARVSCSIGDSSPPEKRRVGVDAGARFGPLTVRDRLYTSPRRILETPALSAACASGEIEPPRGWDESRGAEVSRGWSEGQWIAEPIPSQIQAVARIGGPGGGENETGTDTPELHPSRERGRGTDADDRHGDLPDAEIQEILEPWLRPLGAGCAGADSPREGEIHVGDVEAGSRIHRDSGGFGRFGPLGVAALGPRSPTGAPIAPSPADVPFTTLSAPLSALTPRRAGSALRLDGHAARTPSIPAVAIHGVRGDRRDRGARLESHGPARGCCVRVLPAQRPHRLSPFPLPRPAQCARRRRSDSQRKP